jgi:hypothetical protein
MRVKSCELVVHEFVRSELTAWREGRTTAAVVAAFVAIVRLNILL